MKYLLKIKYVLPLVVTVLFVGGMFASQAQAVWVEWCDWDGSCYGYDDGTPDVSYEPPPAPAPEPAWEPSPSPVPTPEPAPAPAPADEPVGMCGGGFCTLTQEQIIEILTQEAEYNCNEGNTAFCNGPQLTFDANGNLTGFTCANGVTQDCEDWGTCPVVTPPENCTTNPSLPGCTITPPPVAPDCSTDPSLPGCVTVPAADCTADPSLPGCAAGPEPSCSEWGYEGAYPYCYEPTPPSSPSPSPTPAPSPTPTPPPAVTPSIIDIKANNSDTAITVSAGSIVTISWAVNGVSGITCSAFGPNFGPTGPYTFTTTGALITNNKASAPLTAKSEFTLRCVDPLSGTVYPTDSVTVEVAGTIEET